MVTRTDRIAVESVERLTGEDAAVLADLDTSFSTDVVLRITGCDSGFSVQEVAVVPPRTKRYRLAGDLRAGHEPPWDRLFVARSAAEVVAVAATTSDPWNGRQRLDELHVVPSWRGTGLARRLLRRVQAEAVANGAREIWLETQDVNIPAIRAYRRLGFRITGLDLSRYPPPHDAEVAVFMSRPVEPSRAPARYR